jgi:aspartyl-tRNA(Asn)/glutamyl-tRNA(Gln) amidotransferase subunit A
MLTLLSREGAVLVSCPVAGLLAEMRELTQAASIASIEAARIHGAWIRKGSEKLDPRTFEPLSRRLDFPDATYRRMLRRRAKLAAQMDRQLDDFDALAAPTVPIFAPHIQIIETDPAFANTVEALLLRNTQIANQFDFDLPAASQPGATCRDHVHRTARA